MNLKIQKGKEILPLAILLYAKEGFGKSSFGAEATRPLFIGNEVPAHLAVDKIRTNSFLEFLDTLKSVKADKELAKKYKSIVIDSIDGIAEAAGRLVIEGSGRSLETIGGGYAKGHSMVQTKMEAVLEILIELRGMGYNIILLAHEAIVTFDDSVTGTTSSRHDIAMNKRPLKQFKDWVDVILFGQNQRIKKSGDKSDRLLVSKTKVLYTEETGAYVAKNRYNLPEEIEFKQNNKTFQKIAELIFKDLKGE